MTGAEPSRRGRLQAICQLSSSSKLNGHKPSRVTAVRRATTAMVRTAFPTDPSATGRETTTLKNSISILSGLFAAWAKHLRVLMRCVNSEHIKKSCVLISCRDFTHGQKHVVVICVQQNLHVVLLPPTCPPPDTALSRAGSSLAAVKRSKLTKLSKMWGSAQDVLWAVVQLLGLTYWCLRGVGKPLKCAYQILLGIVYHSLSTRGLQTLRAP